METAQARVGTVQLHQCQDGVLQCADVVRNEPQGLPSGGVAVFQYRHIKLGATHTGDRQWGTNIEAPAGRIAGRIAALDHEGVRRQLLRCAWRWVPIGVDVKAFLQTRGGHACSPISLIILL